MTKTRLLSLMIVFVLIAVQQGVCGVACADLKGKIDDGLKAKGVQNYTLTVVPNSDTSTQGKTVGTCDGGTQKILYSRGEPSVKAAAEAEKPAAAAKPAPKKEAASKDAAK